MKWLLHLFYRFADYLCGYEQKKAFSDAHTERIAKIVEELNARCVDHREIEFFGGPHDGAQGVYAGLVIRIAAHPDGAYCFDGRLYKWTSSGCEQQVNNL